MLHLFSPPVRPRVGADDPASRAHHPRPERRHRHLKFDIVDRPGQLATVVAVLSQTGANIVEVMHQRIFTDLPAKAVQLEVVIETRDRSHLAATIAALKAANIDVEVGGDSRSKAANTAACRADWSRRRNPPFSYNP